MHTAGRQSCGGSAHKARDRARGQRNGQEGHCSSSNLHHFFCIARPRIQIGHRRLWPLRSSHPLSDFLILCTQTRLWRGCGKTCNDCIQGDKDTRNHQWSRNRPRAGQNLLRFFQTCILFNQIFLLNCIHRLNHRLLNSLLLKNCIFLGTLGGLCSLAQSSFKPVCCSFLKHFCFLSRGLFGLLCLFQSFAQLFFRPLLGSEDGLLSLLSGRVEGSFALLLGRQTVLVSLCLQSLLFHLFGDLLLLALNSASFINGCLLVLLNLGLCCFQLFLNLCFCFFLLLLNLSLLAFFIFFRPGFLLRLFCCNLLLLESLGIAGRLNLFTLQLFHLWQAQFRAKLLFLQSLDSCVS
mmetsp:Transcript_12214/g.23081  ORF Transcript_12214/g.23081 Transcript_12214/m.23081 type:complete len:350 (-) Transcript_12214:278-1327(-)